jgi:diguanylate cyclase (GGDEF)-like protein
MGAIVTLLALGTLLVVLFMDLVPPGVLGRWRRPAEGLGAIVFLGLLTALTGGAGSPFFVGFFLVVAGTALSTEGRAPLAIALLAAGTVAIVGVADAIDGPLDAGELAWVGFSAVALVLMADIATAAARAQRHARDEALKASRFDALTGLYNRSFFVTTADQEIRRSDRMGRGFTMLMLDLDDLKPVNDTYGHQWGDRLLKAVADTIRETVRSTDAAARYGGDEFVVLLPETDTAGGYVVGEKLRRDIASLTLRVADRNVRSTVSVGLVAYPDDGRTIEQLVAAADVAMYESKRRGKNRIVGYQTRLERVATAIDIEAGELIQLTPAPETRTGGDPAPWGAPSSPAEPMAVAPSGPTEPTGPTAPAGPPAPDRSPAPAGPPASEGSPASDRSPRQQPWLTQTYETRPPGARPTATPSPATSATPRTRSSSLASRPQGGSRSAPGSASTGGSGQPPAPARPSSDRVIDRAIDRFASRSDEIRSTPDRPWIALPIEPIEPIDPTEPPEHPKA